MKANEIVTWMAGWLEKNELPYEGSLAELKVTDVIADSLDVVELTMDMEENVSTMMKFNIDRLAPKFATLTFGELANEIEQFLVQAQQQQTVSAASSLD